MERIFTRRKIVVITAVLILLSTLVYVEHPSVLALKTIASSIGFIDSERNVVGITDVRSIDHTQGSHDANVLLIEYSDFSCVMCAMMQDNLKRIAEEERVLLVSRHLYPETSGTSFEKAVAAECVAKHAGEEAYFSFVQYLYKNQYIPDDSKLTMLQKAISLGTDIQEFERCIASDDRIRARIQNDSEEGWHLGARGTPYIVVVYKGRPIGISYANEYEKFLHRVRSLVANAQENSRT